MNQLEQEKNLDENRSEDGLEELQRKETRDFKLLLQETDVESMD